MVLDWEFQMRSQCADKVLDEIEKAFNETFVEMNFMIYGFRIIFYEFL